MKHELAERRWQPARGLLFPVLLATTAGIALLEMGQRSWTLSATATRTNDIDGDGLVTAQERVLGTSPTRADTDGDGYSDLEELARGSSPIASSSTPTSGQLLTLGMTAHGEPNGIHVLVAMYCADGDVTNKSLHIGYLVHDHLAQMSSGFIASHSSASTYVGARPSSVIGLIDLVIPGSAVNAVGQLSIYAAASLPGSGVVTAASAIHMFSFGGVPVFSMPSPRMGNHHSLLAPGVGTIYVPLLSNDCEDVTSNWSAGEVCLQSASSIGVSGAIVTQEVTSADCSDGWDGLCPPSCSSAVGSTYTTVDPVGLIGG